MGTVSTTLTDKLPEIVMRLVERIDAEMKKPPEDRKDIDIPILIGEFYSTHKVLQDPVYRKAIQAITDKYTIAVNTYQGHHSYMTYGGRDSDPAVRVGIVFPKGSQDVTDAVAEILAKARG